MSTGLKVLAVTQSFGGGVYAVLRDSLNSLAEQGFEIVLAHSVIDDTPPCYLAEFDPRIALRTLPLPTTRLTRSNMRLAIPAVIELSTLISEERPDVVHLHSTVAGFIGRFASLVARAKTPHRAYYTPHGLAFLRSTDSRAKRWGYRIAESLAHLTGEEVIACSGSEHSSYASNVLFGKVRNHHYISNGIEPPAFLAKRPHSPPRRATVVSTGRLSEVKRPDAFAQLARELPELRFLWIGDGEERYHTNLTESGVEVSGWLPKNEVWELLLSSDIYVQYSLWEGLSLALIEAMMAGLPIVASDIAANREATAKDAGMLVSDEAELRSSIVTLANDAPLRERLGRRAQERALEEFSISRMTEGLSVLYRGNLVS